MEKETQWKIRKIGIKEGEGHTSWYFILIIHFALFTHELDSLCFEGF